MTSLARLALCTICALTTLAACDRASPKSEKSSVAGGDDSVRVLTAGNGAWGPARQAVQVLRVATDRDETIFGQVRGLSARPDGGVFVFDAKGAEGLVLRSFDSAGRFERNVGRAGKGPGEYSSEFVRLTVAPDGTALIYEERRVVVRYAPNGRYLYTYAVRNGWQTDIVSGSAGSFYTSAELQPIAAHSTDSIGKARGGPVGGAQVFWKMPRFHYDTAGRVLDTLMLGSAWLPSDEPPHSLRPSQSWFPLADGRIVVSRTDKLAFLLIDRAGKARPVIGEVPSKPVPYLAEERKEQQRAAARSTFFEEGGKKISTGVAPTVVEEYKLPSLPAFADVNGRIWLRKRVTSVKATPRCTVAFANPDGTSRCSATASYYDPPVYIAFNTDGTYLGEIIFPIGTVMVSFVGEFAWVIEHSDDDEQVLVKYRIHP
jgi:hypothetical protein